MRGGIRIGRLFGIELMLDYSWIFVFLLMTWNLSAVFGHWHPDWPVGASFALALVAAVLFFGSVLAHELAHSLVARAFGLRVREIRLFLFGGVSNIEREPPSATAEFWTAVVGPLFSIAWGAGLVLLAALLLPSVPPEQLVDSLSRLGPLLTLLVWLGPINVVIGLFNLVPGFPLDGGRILRAVLWSATKDLHTATFWASTVGRAIGWTFIVTGIAIFFGTRIPFLGEGPVSGLWLAFIGWFLSSAAERSYGQLLVQDVLEGIRVAHLMRRGGYAVTPEVSVSELVNEWFLRSSERAFPVVEEGRLVGLVCVDDLRKAPQEWWGRTNVAAIMTPGDRVEVATPSDDASATLRRLAQLDVDQLPVVEDGYLVGMVDRRDIARWLEIRLGAARRLGTPRHA